jgi:hypothetical protein
VKPVLRALFTPKQRTAVAVKGPCGRLSVIGAVVLSVWSAGCTKTTCSRGEDMTTVTDGIVEGDVYRSAPYGGPYDYFPPARTITFEHGLGTTPYAVQLWVAFSAYGTLAPSAGNITELRGPDSTPDAALNDQSISVYNDSCSDFYLWVVAERSAPSAADGGVTP